MQSIQEGWLKIKNWTADAIGEWSPIVIVLLIGFGSFGLGRLSMLERVRPPVSILQAPTVAEPKGMSIGGLIVALGRAMLTIFLGALVYQKFYYKIRFGSRAGKKRAMPGIFQQKLQRTGMKSMEHGVSRMAAHLSFPSILCTPYAIQCEL